MTIEWLGASAGTCAVCGAAVRGRYLRSADGEVWCVSHASLPRCTWCSIPTHIRLEHAPSCSICAATAQVRTNYRPAVDRVKRWIVTHVGPLPTPIRLRVDTTIALAARSRALTIPGRLGETTWVIGGGGPKIATISMVAGLPRAVFERTLAHEMGHALLAHDLNRRTPLIVVEGIAEALSHAYLASCADERLVSALRTQIETDPDAVYGAGFREIQPGVERLGLSGAFHAVRSGAWRTLLS